MLNGSVFEHAVGVTRLVYGLVVAVAVAVAAAAAAAAANITQKGSLVEFVNKGRLDNLGLVRSSTGIGRRGHVRA